ncbi:MULTISPECIES: hypothetical protein [unclassified Paenibacillus]|uniref:hypothetical protein n=1 Tax=unclassified Paenibacillus TaxID=185978 RepID=UPI002405E27D|nr:MULTISPECIES: hypothetical protein [unclassified Paenibacillus]MDF9843373.1 mannose/fructose/N-acetylgalactosamine-specific phosphotransferase system component IIC [Paenibacillus sp. PastF-2]MDF9849961.1 mannose/fructose/N-acetylgalactosamine-specific phosphotransferase system component IIC [Paenibacillus sp. PastM-2]MDF9856669.1 mannose/fructose/N-acetylgalactosamine-specific phosphotransferase system component IIC [Paenibacillus sp. PastF-1]MDH6481938.1 mannose/fructose/N-acetylgalactosami
MNINLKTPVLVAVSVLLIIASSLLQPEGSTLLGALQTLLLGLGILGCLMAFLRFAKSSKNSSKEKKSKQFKEQKRKR